jgi:hypothetical protein
MNLVGPWQGELKIQYFLGGLLQTLVENLNIFKL